MPQHISTTTAANLQTSEEYVASQLASCNTNLHCAVNYLSNLIIASQNGYALPTPPPTIHFPNSDGFSATDQILAVCTFVRRKRLDQVRWSKTLEELVSERING